MRQQPATPTASFKRQVVFRISADDWPLLEKATREHGTIQAAILAGLHALTSTQRAPAARDRPAHGTSTASGESTPRTAKTPSKPEEITAREAARILGLKVDTVSSYIRSGRLPGHYNETSGHCGWVTNQSAITAYQHRIHTKR